MRLLMYVLAVVAALAIAVICLRGCGHVPTVPAPQATEPMQTTAVSVLPAAPAVLPEPPPLPPPPSPVTNVASAPTVADATLVTLDVILSGQRGIPYEGTVRVDAYDIEYAGARQTKQVQGEPALRFSNVPPMNCYITARLKGYLTTTTNVPLAEAAGTFQTVILQLSALRELRGTVVDATTKAPISYAGVALIAGGTNTVCCDAAGAFAFNEVQDEIASLMAWHTDYPTQQFSIFVIPDGTSSAMLELVRAARIFGHVYDVSGRPVVACSVAYYVYYRQMQFDQEEQARTITDGNGYFDFPQVMPNEMLCVDAQTGDASGSVKLAVRAGEQRELQIALTNRPVALSSNGWIHIIARDSAGAPVTNVILSFYNQFNSTVYGAFDNIGECVLRKRVGTWDIVLLCAGTPPLILTNVAVRYQETTTVHAVLCTLPTPVFGQARRANGTPAAGICIYAAPEDKRAGTGFGAQTDSHGEFSIPVARPDLLYKLTVNEVEIDQPREAVKPGDFVQVVLKPYSIVELQAVASNTMVYIASLSYWGARAPQGKGEFMRGGQAYNGMPHKLLLPSSGAYWVTLKAAGYKPVTLQRTFLPDEDVQLGTVYFEKDEQE